MIRRERIAIEHERARVQKQNAALIDEMERALFEGDIEWFKKQYDDVIETEEIFDGARRCDDFDGEGVRGVGSTLCSSCARIHPSKWYY